MVCDERQGNIHYDITNWNTNIIFFFLKTTLQQILFACLYLKKNAQLNGGKRRWHNMKCCVNDLMNVISLILYTCLTPWFFLHFFSGTSAISVWHCFNNIQIQTWMKDQLISQLQNNYKNNDLTTHEISTAWNYMFMSVSPCCTCILVKL